MANPIHPITEKLLTRQRKVLMREITPTTPANEQLRVSREMLWHAMHTVAVLDPTIDFDALLDELRDAHNRGQVRGVKLRTGL